MRKDSLKDPLLPERRYSKKIGEQGLGNPENSRQKDRITELTFALNYFFIMLSLPVISPLQPSI